MNCCIETATPAHAEVMAALQAECFEDAWSASDFGTFLADPAGISVIALSDGSEPVGFLLARLAGGECEVLSLGVLPARRRDRVGAALLDAILKRAAEGGADACLLEVGSENRAALALYRSAGFREVGRRNGYYARPEGREDALIMRLDLNGQDLRRRSR